MATFRTWKTKDGRRRWQARVRLHGHPQLTRVFANKARAARWATRQEDAIRGGETPPAALDEFTFAVVLDSYVKGALKNKRLKTEAKVIAQLNEWAARFGDYSITRITPALIATERDRMLTFRAPATTNKYLATLSGFFKWCTRERQLMTSNPVADVNKVKEPRGRLRFLSTGERQRLFDAASEDRHRDMYPLIVAATYTGMRQGELLALTWADVDLVEGWAHIKASKNDEPRKVPVRGPALIALRSHNQVRRIDSNQVFGMHKFQHEVWRRIVDRANIHDIRFHDLRHTAASYLIQSGAGIADIAEVLGHKTLAMARRYAHLSPERVGDVVDNMVDKFS